jgi:hypothetical protein
MVGPWTMAVDRLNVSVCWLPHPERLRDKQRMLELSIQQWMDTYNIQQMYMLAVGTW